MGTLFNIRTVLLLLLTLAAVSPVQSSTLNLDGRYANQGTVLVARKDTPNETITLSGLFLTGTGHEQIDTVVIDQEEQSLRLLFIDLHGKTVATETITSTIHKLLVEPSRVSFEKTFKSTNEGGRVTLTITYQLTFDQEGRLIVKSLLRYKTKYLLLFSNTGQDRGVYAFKPANPTGSGRKTLIEGDD